MTVFTGSMSPWCCRRKECIKAITPVSDPLSSLSLLAIVVALLCYPKHFSATSINASVNGDHNWSTSTSSSSTIAVVAILNRTPQRHAGLWQHQGMTDFFFFFFFAEKKYDNIDLDCSQSSIFSVRSSRSSVLWAAILHECQNYLGGLSYNPRRPPPRYIWKSR